MARAYNINYQPTLSWTYLGGLDFEFYATVGNAVSQEVDRFVFGNGSGSTITLEGSEFVYDGKRLISGEITSIASSGSIKSWIRGVEILPSDFFKKGFLSNYAAGARMTETWFNGADVVRGGPDGRYLFGGDGDDRLDGSKHGSVLNGGGGDDRLIGGAADIAYGGDGDDYYLASRTGDYFAGDEGSDTIDFSSATSRVSGLIQVDFETEDWSIGVSGSTFTSSQGASFLTRNVENVIGSRFGDRVSGDVGHNVIRGGAGKDVLIDKPHGDDRLFGGEGDDVLLGGNGDDRLNGGAGDDILTGGGGKTAYQWYSEKTKFTDKLIGGEGDDVFRFLPSESGVRQKTQILADKNDVAFDAPGRRDGDIVDLSRIDADTSTRGDQAFKLETVKEGFGALWRETVGQHTVFRGDVNGDGRPDIEIVIADGAVGARAYTGEDFIL